MKTFVIGYKNRISIKFLTENRVCIMSVVLGEDPESEEEIDTSQIDKLSSTPSKDARSKIPRGEVVAGEESETDEEDNTEETVSPASFVASIPHSPSPDPAHDT